MRSDKANINPFYSKFNNYDETMLVAFDVKYIVLVPNVVNAVETSFDIGKVFPISILNNLDPFL